MELSPVVTSSSADLAVSGWLAEKSRSARTCLAYADTINAFRAALRHQGLDLLSVENQDERRAVGMIAQQYASWSCKVEEDGKRKQVASATVNQRLAILSSFYGYAIRHELIEHNPIERIQRAKIQAYGSARPLDPNDTRDSLQRIDRSMQDGARDYALLAVLLQTGRRLSEVAALTWEDVSINQGKVTLTFHCKGEKIMLDALPQSVANALLAWLHKYYGQALSKLAKGTPLFVSLAKGPSHGKQLGIQAIADVCKKYLGTSKVHTMRHTFAHTMEKAGASVSEIQARLGHENLALTSRYLAQLKRADNRHAERLAAMLGIE